MPFVKSAYPSIRLPIVLFHLTISVLLVVASSEATASERCPETSLAFLIPVSDVVFETEVMAGEFYPAEPGDSHSSHSIGNFDSEQHKARLATREGALATIDLQPSLPGMLGITLERDEKLNADGEETVSISLLEISPDPCGGQAMERIAFFPNHPMGEPLELQPHLKIHVSSWKLYSFGDAALIDRLRSSLAAGGKDALSGLYDVLYSLYGPLASECIPCGKLVMCGTNVSCGGGDGNGSPLY